MDPRAERSTTTALDAAQRLLVTEGIDAITHARIAEASGVGRRTLYRHWPDRRSLLHDTLARTRAPESDPGAGLRDGLVAHLVALDEALTRGPLAYIVAALVERAEFDEAFESLRADLVASGCAPLEQLLRSSARSGDLPADLDLDASVAGLEGPVFHRAMLHRRSTPAAEIDGIVDRFLTAPPRRARPRR